jgi:pimeloyl-ACP methyl ester carboxylesterase
MKKMIKVIGCVVLIIVLLVMCSVIMIRIVNKQRNKIHTENGIEESTYLDINGIKEYVQIRGEDIHNPVIIFIHGGPASPMSYVSSYYQKELESDYTIINYDQRGCGRTYYANEGEKTETIEPEELLSDLDALVDYAKERFGQEQVIIMGHSWGTVLGTLYCKAYPQKVLAYIGVSQIVDLYQGKMILAKQAEALAEKKNKTDADKLKALIDRMEKVDKYEELNVKDLSESAVLVSKYLAVDGEMSGMRQMWIGLTSPDMNLTDFKWFEKQMNIQKFFDMEKGLVSYAFFGFKLNDIDTQYDMPVYYLAGEGDYAAPQCEAKAYFDKIKAPDKEFVEMKNVGHSMFMDNPKTFCDTVKRLLQRAKRVQRTMTNK